MKEWMDQTDPPKEANTVKKLNGCSLLLSSNKTTLCFKERTNASSALKKYIVFINI